MLARKVKLKLNKKQVQELTQVSKHSAELYNRVVYNIFPGEVVAPDCAAGDPAVTTGIPGAT